MTDKEESSQKDNPRRSASPEPPEEELRRLYVAALGEAPKSPQAAQYAYWAGLL